MLFKIDENLPTDVVDLLIRAGHDAVSVLDQQLGGRSDRTIAEVVRAENRTLITLDLDFADIRTFPPGEYAGLIVLRPVAQDKPRVLSVVRGLIPLLKTESLVGKLWIVDDMSVRIRGGTE